MKRLFVIYILTTGMQATTYNTLEQQRPLAKRNTGIRPTCLDNPIIGQAPILRRAIKQLFPTHLERRGNMCCKDPRPSQRKKVKSHPAGRASLSSSMYLPRAAMDMGHRTAIAAVASTSKILPSDRRKSIVAKSSAIEGLTSIWSIDPQPSTSRKHQGTELHAKISTQGSSANSKASFLNLLPERRRQGSNQSVLGSADRQTGFLINPPLRASSLREMPAIRQMGGVPPRLGSEPIIGGYRPLPEYD